MSTATLSGPAWVAVRQHRRALWAGAVLLALAGGTLLYQRLYAASVAGDFAATGCSVETTTRACGSTVRHYLDTQSAFRGWLDRLGIVLLFLPGVLGAFVAGPMIARELESGTYKLAWSQSVTPARWLAAKVAVPAVWAAVTLTVVAGLYRWAWTTGPTGQYPDPWYWKLNYLGLGPLPLAYSLLAIALGALVGLLVRRTVLAMSVTLLAVGAVTLLFTVQVRTHLWPLSTVTGEGLDIGNGWAVEQGMLNASGERLDLDVCFTGVPTNRSQCLTDLGGTTGFTAFHPASHLWPLQLVETGIIVALAALSLFCAFRVLRGAHG